MKSGGVSIFSPITSIDSVYDEKGKNLPDHLDSRFYAQEGESVYIDYVGSIGWVGSPTIIWFPIYLPKYIHGVFPKSFTVNTITIAGNTGDVIRDKTKDVLQSTSIAHLGVNQILASMTFKNSYFNYSSRIHIMELTGVYVQF